MDQGTSETASTVIGHPAAGHASGIDLQQFCGTEEWRYVLHKPFRRGGYVWATNGHILVRVADDERYEEGEVAAEKVLVGLQQAKFIPAPAVKIPPEETVECQDCEGSGKEHDCPDCACKCENCKGSGKQRQETSTSLCGHLFDLRYIRQIYALPDLEIAPDTVSAKGLMAPLLFRFTGGVGVLMPMSSKHAAHVEIEPGKDS